MPANDERDVVLKLLKTAIAALGEEIVELGAKMLPRQAVRQHRIAQKLIALSRDAETLSAACKIFLERSDLLGSSSQ